MAEISYVGLAWRFVRAGLYGTLGAVTAYLMGLEPTTVVVLAIAVCNALESAYKTHIRDDPYPDKKK
jgi:hypothetical protein